MKNLKKVMPDEFAFGCKLLGVSFDKISYEAFRKLFVAFRTELEKGLSLETVNYYAWFWDGFVLSFCCTESDAQTPVEPSFAMRDGILTAYFDSNEIYVAGPIGNKNSYSSDEIEAIKKALIDALNAANIIHNGHT